MNLCRVTQAQMSSALCRYPLPVNATRTAGGGLVFRDPKTGEVIGLVVIEGGKLLRFVNPTLARK